MGYGPNETKEYPALDKSLSRASYTRTKKGWALRVQGIKVEKGEKVNVKSKDGKWEVREIGTVLWRTSVNTVASIKET